MINALRHPVFFRPAGVPPSSSDPAPLPRVESNVGLDKPTRSLNKINFNSFRRTSHALVTIPNTIHPLIQDGSYLEMLGLKLSEAVSKATTQPVATSGLGDQLAGRRPIPSGRGHALGALIASELNAANNNPHLIRAIIRCLHKPLSVLLTTLSAHLPPLLSSPAFSVPPAPTPQAPNANPTQLHALGIATFAGELLESFDELGLGKDNDARGDGLKAVREGLISLVARVVGPLVDGIKSELMATIDALETPVSGNPGAKTMGGIKSSVQHPSITILQSHIPVYARAMARYTTTIQSQNRLATFLVAVIWRSLVALSRRPYVPTSPPSSPAMANTGLKKIKGSNTPPATPPAGRFTMKLPPSRPSSPPAVPIVSSSASDARTLFTLLNLFPRPAANVEATRLAREVVDEAFVGLHALPALLEATNPSVKVGSQTGSLEELRKLTADLSTLISLPLVLRAYGETRTVPVMLGISDAQYKTGCLAGFSRAEECVALVGQKVLQVLRADAHSSPVVVSWLEEEIEIALGDQ